MKRVLTDQDQAGLIRGLGRIRKARDQVRDCGALFLRRKDESQRVLLRARMRQLHLQLQMNILPGEANHAAEAGGERPAQLQLHAVGADLSATACDHCVFQRELDGKIDGIAWGSIGELVHRRSGCERSIAEHSGGLLFHEGGTRVTTIPRLGEFVAATVTNMEAILCKKVCPASGISEGRGR